MQIIDVEVYLQFELQFPQVLHGLLVDIQGINCEHFTSMLEELLTTALIKQLHIRHCVHS